jgi:hypothetical protein
LYSARCHQSAGEIKVAIRVDRGLEAAFRTSSWRIIANSGAAQGAQDALKAAPPAGPDAEALEIIDSINEAIREANRTGVAGPAIMSMPCDVDVIIKQWREQHGE